MKLPARIEKRAKENRSASDDSSVLEVRESQAKFDEDIDHGQMEGGSELTSFDVLDDDVLLTAGTTMARPTEAVEISSSDDEVYIDESDDIDSLRFSSDSFEHSQGSDHNDTSDAITISKSPGAVPGASDDPSESSSSDNARNLRSMWVGNSHLCLTYQVYDCLVLCIGCRRPEALFDWNVKEHVQRFHQSNFDSHLQATRGFFDLHPTRADQLPESLKVLAPVFAIDLKVKCDGCRQHWPLSEQRRCSCAAETHIICVQQLTVDGPELELTEAPNTVVSDMRHAERAHMISQQDDGDFRGDLVRQLSWPTKIKVLAPEDIARQALPRPRSPAESYLVFLMSWINHCTIKTIHRLGFDAPEKISLDKLADDDTLEMAMLFVMRTYRDDLSYSLSPQLMAALDTMVEALDSATPSSQRYHEEQWDMLDDADATVVDAIFSLLSEPATNDHPFFRAMGVWFSDGFGWFDRADKYMEFLLYLHMRLLMIVYKKASIEAPDDFSRWLLRSSRHYDVDSVIGKMLILENAINDF